MSRVLSKSLSLLSSRNQRPIVNLHKQWIHHTTWRRWPDSRQLNPDASLLRISEEVQAAINCGQAIVALESTIITHGMPHPQNIQTATEVEQIIREHGAVPATVAIIGGKLCVGLASSQIEWLGSEANAVKASRRDISYLISQGLNGGTTVSATMIAAHMAGIALFATGGIGGVHRDVSQTFDISADLRELGRTPVTVVSAGVKSILDIAKTLEYLETEGVGVYTFGPVTDFPAFFTRKSGYQSPYNIQTPLDAAKMIDTSQRLGLNSGNLIAVPVPCEQEVDREAIETAIDSATQQARSEGIRGKHVTPFVLDKVNQLMKGDSLRTNIALVKNNAMVASKIAVALSGLRKGQVYQGYSSRSYSTSAHNHNINQRDQHSGRIVVVGGINIDITASFHDAKVLPNGDTYNGNIRQSLGGVGRNIADGLARLGQNPIFLSAIGTDSYLDIIELECSHMDLSNVLRTTDYNSATYCAILDHQGSLINGIGDFDIHKKIDKKYLSDHKELIYQAPLVIFDGNIPAESMAYLTDLCYEHNIPVFFEPTTVSYVPKLFASDAWRRISYVSPNLTELRMLHAGVTSGVFPQINSVSSVVQDEAETLCEVLELCKPLARHIPNILTTIGRHGAVLVRNVTPASQVKDNLSAIHMPVLPSSGNHIVSVSGAGDCLVSAFVTSLFARGSDPVVSLARGILAARLSLQSYRAVPPTLTPEAIDIDGTDDHPNWTARVLMSA